VVVADQDAEIHGINKAGEARADAFTRYSTCLPKLPCRVEITTSADRESRTILHAARIRWRNPGLFDLRGTRERRWACRFHDNPRLSLRIARSEVKRERQIRIRQGARRAHQAIRVGAAQARARKAYGPRGRPRRTGNSTVTRFKPDGCRQLMSWAGVPVLRVLNDS